MLDRNPENYIGADSQTGRYSPHDYIWNGGVEFTGADAEAVPFAVPTSPDTLGYLELPAREVLGRVALETARFFTDRAALPLTQVKPVELITRWASPTGDPNHRMLVRAELRDTRQVPLVSTQLISRGTDGSWNKNSKVDVPRESRMDRVQATLVMLAKSHFDLVLRDSYGAMRSLQDGVRNRPPEPEPKPTRWPFRR